MSGSVIDSAVRHVCALCGTTKTTATARCRACGAKNGLEVESEAIVAARAAERRAARRVFRVYCVTCGRSTEGPTPPPRVDRCPACGGTMLVELAQD